MDTDLSEKQKQFIRDSVAKINIAHGAIRSGKTFSSLIRWGEHVLRCPNDIDEQFLMIGYSYDTIYRNAVIPFMKQFDGYCSFSNHQLTFCSKKISCMGANDQGAVGKIQGSTVAGAYIDEMTLIPQNFLDMLYSRLNPAHSRLFATTNPSSPSHPIKKLIDTQDGKNVYGLHFVLDDNLVLSDEYKDMVKNKLYSSLWKRRYVDGEWTAAEGVIYQCFDRRLHVVSRAPTYAKQFFLGVDYGTSNPFAALLVGYNGDNHPSLWVEKEYYWNPKETNLQKTNSQFADAIQFCFSGYPIKQIFLDPSAESFEVELRKRKLPVMHADNDVDNGIQTVDDLLSSGDLVITSGCANLIREMEGYTWDPKAAKDGKEEPIKVNDHACDALRYCIYSKFGKTKRVGNSDKGIKSDPWPNPGHGWQQFGSGSQR